MRIKGKIAIWFWIMFVGMEILMLYLFFEPSEEGKDVGMLVIMIFVRSEERRVGKECRL